MNCFQKIPLACSQGQLDRMFKSSSNGSVSSRISEQLSRQSRYNPLWYVWSMRTSNDHVFALSIALVEIIRFFAILSYAVTIIRRIKGIVRRIESKKLIILVSYLYDSRNSHVRMGWRMPCRFKTLAL